MSGPWVASAFQDQFQAVKAEHNGDILLFKMGDFYETFFEDAVFVSRETRTPLSVEGFPYPVCRFLWCRALGIVQQLRNDGYKVSIIQ